MGANTMQNSADEEDPEDLGPSIRKRAPRTAKEVGKLDPETLGYYPETWKIVLQRTKLKYRRHVFLFQAFPKRGHDLATAREILIDCITECEEEGFILDNGKYSCSSLYATH
jgi:hypothetical protein